MKCPNCGTEFEGSFCPECGTPAAANTAAPESAAAPTAGEPVVTKIPETVLNEASAATTAVAPDLTDRIIAKAKSFCTKKNALIAGAVVVVLLLIGAIGNTLFSSSPFDAVRATILGAPGEDDTTYFLYNNKEVGSLANAGSNATSADGTVMVVLDGDGALYTVTSSGVKKIGVSDASSVLGLSYDGTGALYKNTDGELFLLNVGKKKAVRVTDVSVSNAVLSPDGDVAVYAISEDGEMKMYYFNGKDSTFLGKSVRPVSVDNSGNYIFAYNGEALYRYTRKGDDKEKLGDASSSSFYLNSDGTQILFFDSGKTYLSVKGGEKIRVNGSTTSSVLLPAGSIAGYSAGIGSYAGELYGCDDLLDALFLAGGSVYTYHKDGEKEKVASGTSSPVWTEDRDYLFYADGKSLYRKEVGSDADAVELTDELSGGYYVTSDGKYAYFRDSSDTLYGIKNTGKPKKISDDAENLFMSGRDILFFLNGDDELLAVSNGSSAKRIAKDVGGVTGRGELTLYFNHDGEYYASNGSTSFKRVLKNVVE